MSKPFQYSALRYQPSSLLEEQINIGILFYFVADAKVIFVFPNALSRVNALFSQAGNLSELRYYLQAFRNKANALTKSNHFAPQDLETIIRQHFLIEDANSFFFSEIKFGFYESPDQILSYYKEAFFHAYTEQKTAKKRNDQFLKEQFDKTLKKLAGTQNLKLHYFQKSFEIENNIAKTEFDFAWRNGTTNLIKNLSFDLSDETYIQEKSFRWYGELSQLKERAAAQNFRFDLIVAPPQRGELFQSYDKALHVLEKIEAKHQIIEEKNIKNYLTEALDTVKPMF